MKKSNTFASLSGRVNNNVNHIKNNILPAVDQHKAVETIAAVKSTTRPDANAYKKVMVGDTNGYVLNISSTIRGMTTSDVVSREQFTTLVDGKLIGNAAEAFKNASRLTEQPYVGTVLGTDVHGMYEGCVGLHDALIDAPNVIDASRMYAGCSALETVIMSDDTAPICMREMFMNCSSLPQNLDTVINLSKVDDTTGVLRMFKGTPVRKLKVIYDGGEPPPFISPNLMGEELREITIVDSSGAELATRTRANSVTSYSGRSPQHGSYTASISFANGKPVFNQMNPVDLTNVVGYTCVDDHLEADATHMATLGGIICGQFELPVSDMFDLFTTYSMGIALVNNECRGTSNYKVIAFASLPSNFPTDFLSRPEGYGYTAGQKVYQNRTYALSTSYSADYPSKSTVWTPNMTAYNNKYIVGYAHWSSNSSHSLERAAHKIYGFSFKGTGNYYTTITYNFNTSY